MISESVGAGLSPKKRRRRRRTRRRRGVKFPSLPHTHISLLHNSHCGWRGSSFQYSTYSAFFVPFSRSGKHHHSCSFEASVSCKDPMCKHGCILSTTSISRKKGDSGQCHKINVFLGKPLDAIYKLPNTLFKPPSLSPSCPNCPCGEIKSTVKAFPPSYQKKRGGSYFGILWATSVWGIFLLVFFQWKRTSYLQYISPRSFLFVWFHRGIGRVWRQRRAAFQLSWGWVGGGHCPPPAFIRSRVCCMHTKVARRTFTHTETR